MEKPFNTNNAEKTEALYKHALDSCKHRIPVPFDQEKAYLILYENGSYIGLATTETQAQKVATEWIWELDEGHREMRFGKQKTRDHFYYIVLLRPDTNWSKKYLAGREDLTPRDEYAHFSANHFYDQIYLNQVKENKLKEEAETVRRVLQQRKSEAENFWTGTVLFLILVAMLLIFNM